MTLQEHYNIIKEGKGGNKTQFLKIARQLFPEYINQYSDFDTATRVLKSKQVISEANAGGVVTKGFDIFDWKKILAEEVKAEEKETSKEVKDAQKHAYDNADMKNADNINFNEIMKGFYAELKDAKNHDKTGDELKDIVVKNLAKDPLYYTKDGEFGVKGIGYTTEAPGLGTPKEAKGKHKSSGYGDIEKEVKVKANVQDSLGDKEAKTSDPKKVKEMTTTPQNSAGVKKMKMSGVEKIIKLKEGLSLAELLKESKEDNDGFDTRKEAEKLAMQRSHFNKNEIYYVEEENGKYKAVKSMYDEPPRGVYFQNGNRKGGSYMPSPGNVDELLNKIKLKEGIHDRDITSASHTNVRQLPGGFWDNIKYKDASKLFDYHERTGDLPTGLSSEKYKEIMKKFNISRMDDSDIPFKNMTENELEEIVYQGINVSNKKIDAKKGKTLIPTDTPLPLDVIKDINNIGLKRLNWNKPHFNILKDKNGNIRISISSLLLASIIGSEKGNTSLGLSASKMGTGVTSVELNKLSGEFKKLVKTLNAGNRLKQEGNYVLLDVPTKYNEEKKQYEMPLPKNLPKNLKESIFRALIQQIIKEELKK